MDAEVMVQLALGVIGTGGVIGGIVALVKLRPDITTAAVNQSQVALSMMETINRELEEAKQGWQDRALRAEGHVRLLQKQVRDLGHEPVPDTL